MMKWEAESKGYSCNDCYLSMQNCHDLSICCEDETGLCDFFEEIPTELICHAFFGNLPQFDNTEFIC